MKTINRCMMSRYFILFSRTSCYLRSACRFLINELESAIPLIKVFNIKKSSIAPYLFISRK